MAKMPDRDLRTSKETCEYLRISRRTLDKLVKTGKLVPAVIGNKHVFSQVDINNFLAAARRPHGE